MPGTLRSQHGLPGYPKSVGTDVSLTGGHGSGKGGGRMGGLLISPFVGPGGTSSTPYNHYSQGFGTDVWSNYKYPDGH